MPTSVLPRWLLALAEQPGSRIETLNRAERLGAIEDVTRWLEARHLRKRLVHEYMTDSTLFAVDLGLAQEYSAMLVDTYNRVRREAMGWLALPERSLTPPLE